MRATWIRNLAYALPALPLAALYLPLFSYVTPFYANERGVDIAALGAAWIAIRMFDAVSDPLAGWLSDRTVRVIGRRGWVILAVPLILVATWQAFVPPEDAGLPHAVLWLFVLTLGWTLAQTPYYAWGAELDTSYDGRTRVTAWREAVVLVGTLAATLLYFGGGEGGDGLFVVAVAVVIALPITVAIAALGAREAPRPEEQRLTIAKGWQAMRENRPFRILILAWFVNGAANGLPVTLFLFFVASYLGAGEAEFAGSGLKVGAACLLAYFAFAILGVPFWSWLARRTSKHRAWSIAMIWACLIFAWALTLQEGDFLAFFAISVLTGLAFGADLSLPPAIQADVVELDSLRTGTARAGLFFALWQVATKAAVALSSGLGLILLGQAGFDANGQNDETALTALLVLYAGVPIVLKLAAVALVWRFPLDAAALRTARAQPA